MKIKKEWICTCEAGYRGEIYHCPLHKAAPDMYEALQALSFQFAAAIEHPYSKDKAVYEQAEKALAKAEGK